jgi:L-methionine (R)-S-oxide reductase
MTDLHAHAEEAVRQAVAEEADSTDAMERAVSILKERLPAYDWVGIYLLHGNELVLGPFAGKPSPHTRIPLGRGICGAAAAEKATIIVDDVQTDSRYLACSADTRSEIVVPILRNGDVLGEIDVDSDQPGAFGPRDQALLESIARLLAGRLGRNDLRGSP